MKTQFFKSATALAFFDEPPAQNNAKYYDKAFRVSERKLSKKLIKNRLKPSRAYLGKIPDAGSFPLNSGTEIHGNRLGRPFIPEGNWRKVTDDLCTTNAHLIRPEKVWHGGSAYSFFLVARELTTDYINLASLALRADPWTEIEHIEQGLSDAAVFVHEDFRRNAFLAASANKVIGKVSESGGNPVDTDVADDGILNNGWTFEQFSDGQPDYWHIRAAIDPTKIDCLSLLSADMLDFAQIALNRIDDGVRLDEVNMYDVLLASPKMITQMKARESEYMNDASANVSQGWNLNDLSREFGTEGVVRNYSLRTDHYAWRGYPDTTFNTALVAEVGYAFDDQDPETWPRFVKVPALRAKKSKANGVYGPGGVESEPNPDWLYAPFGISTILTKDTINVMSFPPNGSIRSAKLNERVNVGFDGRAVWLNIEHEDNNPVGEIGKWLLRFRMAAEPVRPENGFAYFHRLDHASTLHGINRTLRTRSTFRDVTPYCIDALGQSPTAGANMVQ